jgi:hypothetical protein
MGGHYLEYLRYLSPRIAYVEILLSVRATLNRTLPRSSGSSSLAEAGLWRIKVNTHDETTAHLADYIRDLTA